MEDVLLSVTTPISVVKTFDVIDDTSQELLPVLVVKYSGSKSSVWVSKEQVLGMVKSKDSFKEGRRVLVKVSRTTRRRKMCSL